MRFTKDYRFAFYANTYKLQQASLPLRLMSAFYGASACCMDGIYATTRVFAELYAI